jgi:hypothetical protein
MYRFAKNPEIPSSTPDRITFPFDFATFSYSFENYVKSFTRNRVSKEKINEVIEEINTSVQPDGDSFNTWDVIALVTFALLTIGAVYCIITLRLEDLTIWLIKFLLILFFMITNVCIWGYCQSGTISRMRNKVQFGIDSQEDFYEEMGMKWMIPTEHDFPYWIELHVQSEFEMKDDVKQSKKGKKKRVENSFSERKGMLEQDEQEDYPEEMRNQFRRQNEDEDEDEEEQPRHIKKKVTPAPKPTNKKSKEAEISISKTQTVIPIKKEVPSRVAQAEDDEEPDEAPTYEGSDDDEDQRSV